MQANLFRLSSVRCKPQGTDRARLRARCPRQCCRLASQLKQSITSAKAHAADGHSELPSELNSEGGWETLEHRHVRITTGCAALLSMCT